ncbi:MAG: DUF559 domain-containing protein [Clostridia bacterium]|nr:DUF559 domain-containing protein [Clostridia bacterium]MBO4885302.1 DUF559 domain-containing protein [Clostridia bacterium]
MNNLHNRNLTPNAQRLRREMTKEERHLWYDFLKPLPITVNRQKSIGSYIADFYIAKAKIVIELDGSQHYEEKGLVADKARDDFFRANGVDVLRYTNLDIRQNFSGVCQDIIKHLSGIEEISLQFTESLPLEGKVPRRGG